MDAMSALVLTGPADLRDQRWLDERVAAIEDGIEAVLDIARNWTEGRNVARFHPGVSAAEYVTSRVGTLGKSVVPVLLAESNWSNRQIAAVAGVSPQTVTNTVRELSTNGQLPARSAETLGADGKLRPARKPQVTREPVMEEAPEEEGDQGWESSTEWKQLRHFMEQGIAFLSARPADSFASSTPPGSRDQVARRLRKIGFLCGEIALLLERSAS